MRHLKIAMLSVPLLLAAACGTDPTCRDGGDCETPSPAADARTPVTPAATASPTATSPAPTPDPATPSVPGPGTASEASATADVYFSSPTPPPTPVPPTPTVTATLTPPLPGTFPTRPPDPPFTPEPRPATPTADDIKIGSNGKYYARVDGCRWDEFRRAVGDDGTVVEVGLTTPCLPGEAIIYYPGSGEVDHVVS